MSSKGPHARGERCINKPDLEAAKPGGHGVCCCLAFVPLPKGGTGDEDDPVSKQDGGYMAQISPVYAVDGCTCKPQDKGPKSWASYLL
jgi:hypothetical protein